MSKQIELLYIDDEEINLLLFEANFKNHFQILTAFSAFEGLEIMAHTPQIGVVICDLKMPGMNGLEFISKAKSLYPNTLFYILSGYDATPEISTAIDAGLIEKHFLKPFDLPTIISSIHQALP